MNKSTPNKESNTHKLLQDLKIEYFKYKNNLQNTIETHKILKNRINKEKNTNVQYHPNEFNCSKF
jgi:hypothetical protein